MEHIQINFLACEVSIMNSISLNRPFRHSNSQIQAMWDREYMERRALPSTLSDKPSRCLSRVTDLLPSLEGLKILDIGCGNGRHSKIFARQGAVVHAMDISGAAIEICKNNLKQGGLDQKVTLHHKSCLDSLPAIERGFDIVLDSYMSCHLTDFDERSHFFSQIQKSLAPPGIFLSFGISPGDAYYAQYAEKENVDGAIVVDQLSKIPKIITSSSYLRREYYGLFEVVLSEDLLMRDRMGAQDFDKAAVLMAAELGPRQSK